MNRTARTVELFSGGGVVRSRPLDYVDVSIRAVGIGGRLRLEGAPDSPLCPRRRVVEPRFPVRRPPCRNDACTLALRPGESLEIPWSGWLLVPEDRVGGPRDETGCFRRRAPLPADHAFEVCGSLDGFGGPRICARAELPLPAERDVVLAFQEGEADDAR